MDGRMVDYSRGGAAMLDARCPMMVHKARSGEGEW
jgi:hypothetical protein